MCFTHNAVRRPLFPFYCPCAAVMLMAWQSPSVSADLWPTHCLRQCCQNLNALFPLLLDIWCLLFTYKTMFDVTAPHDVSLRQQQVLPRSAVFFNFFPSSRTPSVTLSLIISFFSCFVVISFVSSCLSYLMHFLC